jgi:ribulose 1,5-bisphosphate synthetase/thiazole synthase
VPARGEASFAPTFSKVDVITSEVNITNTYHESSRDIPVYAEVDVVVAGGGPAGIGAAIAAARNGSRTLLIERLSFLGGVATAAPMPVLNVPVETFSGVCRELFGRLIASGGAVSGRLVNFDPEMLKEMALDMALESGVELLFYTWVVAPIKDGDTLRGVIIENKSGRQAVLAKVVIDCTGDADIASASGVPCVKGREVDGKMRPVTTLFRMGGVDVARVVDYSRAHPEEFTVDPNKNVLDIDEGVVRIEGFYDTVKRARENDELDANIHYLRMEGVDIQKGIVFINNVRVYNIDGTSSADLTRAEIEARRQMRQLAAFIQKYIPGCEQSFFIDSAVSIGVRETRRIRGDYLLTADDCFAGQTFLDGVVELHRRVVYGHEIHSPDAGEGGENDSTRREAGLERTFQIPYRSLLPQRVEGLLVAGRSISGDHDADAWFRGIYSCISMGQGAGTGAALAVRSGVVPRQVDVQELRRTLAAQGVNLGATPVEVALPVG